MNINIFYRKKNINQYSIEKVYNTLIPFFPKKISIHIKEMPCYSKGFFNKIYNILYTIFNQSDVNHISGDIHYINLLVRKKNTILTIHDIFPIHRSKGIKKTLFKLFWFKIPIRKAKIITTVSNFSKKEILANFDLPSTKIKVIYNCLSPLFQSSPKPFNKEKPLILHIGTKDNKNLTNLIKAVNGLTIKINIVGELNTEQKLLLTENQVDFNNFQNVSDEQLFSLYRECDILSFISTYEGFGLPIIEAQSVGRPVITSNLSSMPEIAGEGALLVNPHSIESIHDGIKKVINDDIFREKLILKGHENIKRFDPENIAYQYLQLYKEVKIDS